MNEEWCYNFFKKFSLNEKSEQMHILQEIGLLDIQPSCEICGLELKLIKRETVADGYRWRCYNKSCCKFKVDISIRKKSFFENTTLPLSKCIEIIYYWAREYRVKDAAYEASIAEKTAIEIYKSMRELASAKLRAFPLQLGGPGIICEVDVSPMSHKVKAHRGRAPSEQIWVFGIADRTTKPATIYVEMVPDRSAATLIPIINRVCRPGTIIHSDMWRSYHELSRSLRYDYGAVDHSRHFVDPISGVHTQAIESAWNRIKYRFKQLKGVRREHLKEYLDEFMWKSQNKQDILLNTILILQEYLNQVFN